MRRLARILPLIPISSGVLALLASGVESAPRMAGKVSSLSESPLVVSNDAIMEEGKVLYANGQYIAALGKFMTVLRRDPHEPEARRYLRMVIDVMRQSPGTVSSPKTSAGKASVSPVVVEEEARKTLQKRALLSMDLKGIPGVRVEVQSGSAQVRIDTALLFASQTGGLREEGIPILDRVSAWLKTFGQQLVIIHCYPEELQDPATNGSLFLHRYSELYSFFVDERKLAAQRFVSADLLTASGEKGVPKAEKVEVSSGTSRVVIETVGGQSAFLESMQSSNPRLSSHWLEFSLEIPRNIFNPDEGEWATFDAAALSRSGLRNWSFVIRPAKKDTDILTMQGKGNLLRRLSWDGHNQLTGSLVTAGRYICQLTATDSDGAIKKEEKSFQVLRTHADAPVALNSTAKKHPVKKSPEQKWKGEKTAPQPSPIPGPSATADTSALIDTKPVAAVGTDSPSPAAPLVGGPSDQAPGGPQTDATASPADGEEPAAEAAESADSGDSSQAIWKQVIQFERGQSDIKPTLKSSLERIGKTLEVYPLQKVRILGFAAASEQGAGALAQKRAEGIRDILVDEYHVDRKRVIVGDAKVLPGGARSSKVELSITN